MDERGQMNIIGFIVAMWVLFSFALAIGTVPGGWLLEATGTSEAVDGVVRDVWLPFGTFTTLSGVTFKLIINEDGTVSLFQEEGVMDTKSLFDGTVLKGKGVEVTIKDWYFLGGEYTTGGSYLADIVVTPPVMSLGRPVFLRPLRFVREEKIFAGAPRRFFLSEVDIRAGRDSTITIVLYGYMDGEELTVEILTINARTVNIKVKRLLKIGRQVITITRGNEYVTSVYGRITAPYQETYFFLRKDPVTTVNPTPVPTHVEPTTTAVTSGVSGEVKPTITGGIQGHVYGGVGVSPLAGVTVRADTLHSTTTGTKGEYTLVCLPGTYRVEVVEAGRVLGSRDNVIVSHGAWTTLDFNNLKPPVVTPVEPTLTLRKPSPGTTVIKKEGEKFDIEFTIKNPDDTERVYRDFHVEVLEGKRRTPVLDVRWDWEDVTLRKKGETFTVKGTATITAGEGKANLLCRVIIGNIHRTVGEFYLSIEKRVSPVMPYLVDEKVSENIGRGLKKIENKVMEAIMEATKKTDDKFMKIIDELDRYWASAYENMINVVEDLALAFKAQRETLLELARRDNIIHFKLTKPNIIIRAPFVINSGVPNWVSVEAQNARIDKVEVSDASGILLSTVAPGAFMTFTPKMGPLVRITVTYTPTDPAHGPTTTYSKDVPVFFARNYSMSLDNRIASSQEYEYGLTTTHMIIIMGAVAFALIVIVIARARVRRL